MLQKTPRTPTHWYATGTGPHTEDKLMEDVRRHLKECKWPDEDVAVVEIVLHEAIANAIQHGNDNDASKEVIVGVSCSATAVHLEVINEGDGFDPPPLFPLSDQIMTDRGLNIIAAHADSLEFKNDGRTIAFTLSRVDEEEE